MNINRYETNEMKKEREVKELLEEIKEEKKQVNELIEKLEKAKKDVENKGFNEEDIFKTIEKYEENKKLEKIKIIEKMKNYDLTQKEIEQIEEWTNK